MWSGENGTNRRLLVLVALVSVVRRPTRLRALPHWSTARRARAQPARRVLLLVSIVTQADVGVQREQQLMRDRATWCNRNGGNGGTSVALATLAALFGAAAIYEHTVIAAQALDLVSARAEVEAARQMQEVQQRGAAVQLHRETVDHTFELPSAHAQVEAAAREMQEVPQGGAAAKLDREKADRTFHLPSSRVGVESTDREMEVQRRGAAAKRDKVKAQFSALHAECTRHREIAQARKAQLLAELQEMSPQLGEADAARNATSVWVHSVASFLRAHKAHETAAANALSFQQGQRKQLALAATQHNHDLHEQLKGRLSKVIEGATAQAIRVMERDAKAEMDSVNHQRFAASMKRAVMQEFAKADQDMKSEIDTMNRMLRVAGEAAMPRVVVLPQLAAPCSMMPPVASLDQDLAPILPARQRPIIVNSFAPRNRVEHTDGAQSNRERATLTWHEAFHRNQNPQHCKRYLLVEDDLDAAGLGWTTRMLASLLVAATAQRRVLLEVPVNDSWGHAGKQANEWHNHTGLLAFGDDVKLIQQRARWCDRAPFTMQCVFDAWSACPLPDQRVSHWYTPGQRPRKDALAAIFVDDSTRLPKVLTSSAYRNADVVRIKLSWFAGSDVWSRHHCEWASHTKIQQLLCKTTGGRLGSRQHAYVAAVPTLFHPRPWVKAIAQCVLESAQRKHPSSHLVINVHMRDSVQKDAEIKSRSRVTRMPPPDAYFELARAVSLYLRTPHVVVQTANPVALADFLLSAQLEALCEKGNHTRCAKMHVTFTNNTRSVEDTWGGWQPTGQMEDATVAAVNLELSLQSDVVITPKQSAWTGLITVGFERAAAICCAMVPSAVAWWRGGCRGGESNIFLYVRKGVALDVPQALRNLEPPRQCLVMNSAAPYKTLEQVRAAIES